MAESDERFSNMLRMGRLIPIIDRVDFQQLPGKTILLAFHGIRSGSEDFCTKGFGIYYHEEFWLGFSIKLTSKHFPYAC